MKITRKRLVDEAVKRMNIIGLGHEIIKQFVEKSILRQSLPPYYNSQPVLPEIDVDNELLSRIDEFERKHNALVYYVIRSYTDIGEMEAYLYVSKYKEEWIDEHNDLRENRALAYVANLDHPDCSEFGSIGFELVGSSNDCRGLKRTW